MIDSWMDRMAILAACYPYADTGLAACAQCPRKDCIAALVRALFADVPYGLSPKQPSPAAPLPEA